MDSLKIFLFIICFLGGGFSRAAYLDAVEIINVPLPVTGTFWQATQPVSLLSVPTHAVTQSGTWNVGLSTGSNAIGSITNSTFASTQSGAWSVTANAGANLNTSALNLESTQSAINGKLNSLGQKNMANSMPVTIASDQSAVPSSQSGSWTTGRTWNLTSGSDSTAAVQSGTWNINNISGTISLPTGAATSANQSSELTLTGSATETAPASDTASSGLNGRLQRIAQRLTSLIAVFNPITTAPGNSDSGIVVRPITSEYATFSVVSPATVVGNGKSMLAIKNTGTAIVRIREIWIINDQTTAVTGVAGDFQVLRIASFTGGTSLTISSFDSADTLPSGITAATGATVATETVLLRQGRWSTDDWGPGTADTESFDHAIQNTEPFWRQTPAGKAITIRQNQAIHVKFATNSTAGAFNIRLVFTTE